MSIIPIGKPKIRKFNRWFYIWILKRCTYPQSESYKYYMEEIRFIQYQKKVIEYFELFYTSNGVNCV